MSSFLITFRILSFTLDFIYSLLSSPEDIIEINTFIQQGNTMLIKNDSKDIYIITKQNLLKNAVF